MTIDEIYEEFDGLDNWEDRCDYLIDLGFDLPDFPEEEKTEANRVHGCQSNVWMTLSRQKGEGNVVQIQADSDAMIVRGLIAVLHALYSGLNPEAVLAVDAPAELGRLGLDQHLSSQRSNGLRAMVGRIRAIAQSALARA
jgi:cysteine desulfuration protein SufE